MLCFLGLFLEGNGTDSDLFNPQPSLLLTCYVSLFPSNPSLPYQKKGNLLLIFQVGSVSCLSWPRWILLSWEHFHGATSWWSDPSYNPVQRNLFTTLLWPLYPEDLKMHSQNTNAKDCQLYSRYPLLATNLCCGQILCQKQLTGKRVGWCTVAGWYSPSQWERHGRRSRQFTAHLASSTRKQRKNRKWGEAPIDVLFQGSLPLLRVSQPSQS